MKYPFLSLPGTIEELKMSVVRKCFPPRCKFQVQMRKSSSSGERYPEIYVTCTPSMGEEEYDYCKQSVCDSFPIKEIYTEQTGHEFFIYPKNDKTKPFTFIMD